MLSAIRLTYPPCLPRFAKPLLGVFFTTWLVVAPPFTRAQSTSAPIVDVLHSFSYSDSINPKGGLIRGTDGSFYGVTYGNYDGSGADYGSIFKVTPDGQFTTLHKPTIIGTFDYRIANDGGASYSSSLIQGNDGAFYGVTSYGGQYTYGTAFRVTADGEYTTLHDFTEAEGTPEGGLVQGADGNFYLVTGSLRPTPLGIFTNSRQPGR